eukprot:TRINITY_DN28_c0_g1_i2.p1 TRINITY_DN28_c0_g1~~TRINITY_DN28_c0_g1_i2.p1  ORF type:complete len:345 (-),score=70.21 TRINITY_DN28_c0_g1_i2:58-1059(-)
MSTHDKAKTSSDYYFDSYSHHGIHEEMLKDEVRTRGYRNAILNNVHVFKGKTVLDIGCGTGILCLFAAKAGAAKVIGIECSGIYEQAQEIIKLNKYDHIITLIRGKVEEVELPVEKVDIIISEWMGYFLLYESMLNTVLYARDKWLVKEGGRLFPDKATMFIAGIEDAEYKQEKIGFWDNVYGFDFAPIKRLAMLEPLVDTVSPDQLCTEPAVMLEIDLMTATVSDLSFKTAFTVKAKRRDMCHALVAWFDTDFTQVHRTVKISTSPFGVPTHWKQTVFYLAEPLAVEPGEEFQCELQCLPNQGNHRDLDIHLKINFEGKSQQIRYEQDFRLR